MPAHGSHGYENAPEFRIASTATVCGARYAGGMGAASIRRVLLGVTALVFTGIAVASLVAPDHMAAGLGYTLTNVDARSEYRAIYVGLWLAHAVVAAMAARHVDDTRLGDVVGILVLGQVVGRVVSIAADGELPSMKILPIATVEAVGAIALLLVRPGERPGTPR